MSICNYSLKDTIGSSGVDVRGEVQVAGLMAAVLVVGLMASLTQKYQSYSGVVVVIAGWY